MVSIMIPPLLQAQAVLRGRVRVEFEPIYGGYIDVVYPLDMEGASRRALEEASMFFAAQIYGWSFHYDIGERARGIDEEFTLTPLGEIYWGDPAFHVTHAYMDSNVMNPVLSVWMDYRPREYQQRRLEMWAMGNVRPIQGTGYGPYGNPHLVSTWLEIKREALEDAARAAVRAMLQGQERNRPKEVRGLIALENFPSYHIDAGRWACQARFRVIIEEIIPFAAH